MQDLKEFETFLKKLDEVDDIFKGKSPNSVPSDDCSSGKSRTVINTSNNNVAGGDQAAFMKAVEEDAAERKAKWIKDENEAEKLRVEGNAAFKSGSYEKAIEIYSKAISVYPRDPRLWTNRALAYMKLGQYENALSDCDWSTRACETHTKGYVLKSSAHRKLGDIKSARDCIKEGIERCPQHNSSDLRLLEQNLKELDLETVARNVENAQYFAWDKSPLSHYIKSIHTCDNKEFVRDHLAAIYLSLQGYVPSSKDDLLACINEANLTDSELGKKNVGGFFKIKGHELITPGAEKSSIAICRLLYGGLFPDVLRRCPDWSSDDWKTFNSETVLYSGKWQPIDLTILKTVFEIVCIAVERPENAIRLLDSWTSAKIYPDNTEPIVPGTIYEPGVVSSIILGLLRCLGLIMSDQLSFGGTSLQIAMDTASSIAKIIHNIARNTTVSERFIKILRTCGLIPFFLQKITEISSKRPLYQHFLKLKLKQSSHKASARKSALKTMGNESRIRLSETSRTISLSISLALKEFSSVESFVLGVFEKKTVILEMGILPQALEDMYACFDYNGAVLPFQIEKNYLSSGFVLDTIRLLMKGKFLQFIFPVIQKPLGRLMGLFGTKYNELEDAHESLRELWYPFVATVSIFSFFSYKSMFDDLTSEGFSQGFDLSVYDLSGCFLKLFKILGGYKGHNDYNIHLLELLYDTSLLARGKNPISDLFCMNFSQILLEERGFFEIVFCGIFSENDGIIGETVKILALLCANECFLNKIAEKEGLIAILLVCLDRKDSVVLCSDVALLFGYLVTIESVAIGLINTNIVQELLTVAGEATNMQLRANILIALSRLVKHEPKHLLRLRDLNGVAIMHSYMESVAGIIQF